MEAEPTIVIPETREEKSPSGLEGLLCRLDQSKYYLFEQK
jgi:hypothetical protein